MTSDCWYRHFYGYGPDPVLTQVVAVAALVLVCLPSTITAAEDTDSG